MKDRTTLGHCADTAETAALTIADSRATERIIEACDWRQIRTKEKNRVDNALRKLDKADRAFARQTQLVIEDAQDYIKVNLIIQYPFLILWEQWKQCRCYNIMSRKAQYRKNSLKFDNWQKASRQCPINRIHLKKAGSKGSAY